MDVQNFASNSESFLDTILEHLPLAIFVKEASELRFVKWNKAAVELFGFPQDQIIGKTDKDLFPEEQAEFFNKKDREVLRNKVLVDIPEEPINTNTKGKRILHTMKVPLLDKNGEAIYLLGVSEDITERKNQTAQMEKLNEMMIGRENRMRELKAEIDRLKNELATKG